MAALWGNCQITGRSPQCGFGGRCAVTAPGRSVQAGLRSAAPRRGQEPEMSARGPLARTRPSGDRVRPRQPPGREQDPGDRVGFHHVRRGAAGVPGALHALDGRKRRDAHLDRAAGCLGGQQAEQVHDGQPGGVSAPAPDPGRSRPAPRRRRRPRVPPSVTGPGHSGRPSAARCAFTAASRRAGSPLRAGIAANLAGRSDGSGAARARIRYHQTA